jgi:predicted esterase
MKPLMRAAGLLLTAILLVGVISAHGGEFAPRSVGINSDVVVDDSFRFSNSTDSSPDFLVRVSAPIVPAPSSNVSPNSNSPSQSSADGQPRTGVSQSLEASDRGLTLINHASLLKAPVESVALPVASSDPARDLHLSFVSSISQQELAGKLGLFVHLPPDAAAYQPLRVLVALHGVGSNGETFAQDLIGEADQNHWLLLAPTIQYVNWMEPSKLLDDDLLSGRMLHAELDALPARLNLKLIKPVMIFGFSRGAQLGHRFAYFHPDYVDSVVVLSGGSYTLPNETDGASQPRVLPLPYGVGDMSERMGQPLDLAKLKQIHFYVGVGANDINVNDVPREFDVYVGRTRVERAQRFCQALKAVGVDASLTIFPNVGHQVTNEMRAGAINFLKQTVLGVKSQLKP